MPKIFQLIFSKAFLIFFTVIFLFLFGDFVLYLLAAIFIYLSMVARVFSINTRKRVKTSLIVSYTMYLPIEIVTFILVVFDPELSGVTYHFVKLFGLILMMIPLMFERITLSNPHNIIRMPSLEDVESISFAFAKDIKERYHSTRDGVGHIIQSASPVKIKELVIDLPRHSSMKYINEGSLSEVYFEKARDSLDDPYLYIVVSNTGSAASEIISLFTQKAYNHASLSFDYDLETIISYNGGEKLFPPGLNTEMIDFFNKKEDSSIVVYRLEATKEQKEVLINKVGEINREGSAYNILGLVLKYSHRPNIMFCSQFVYTMLSLVGLEYFQKKPELVQPSDLVELDYYRKLEFAYEVKFN